MHRTRERETEYEARVIPYSRNGNGNSTILASYTIRQNEVYKYVDILKTQSYITLFLTTKSYDRALSAAKKVGRVLFCQKIDPSYKLKQIEYSCRDIISKPITIEVDRQEIEVSPELEITPAIIEERNIVVEVNGNGVDKL